MCVWARASAAPRHSWLGCWGVCLCSCARSACTPPFLGGVCGVVVCAWARVSAAPCYSWLGSWGVCVFVCALALYPATPDCSVRCGCVCLGSSFRCAPPLLAGLLGCVCVCVCALLLPRHSCAWLCRVVVCASARVSAAPCHYPLGCWGVCVFVCALHLYPAIPGWGVRCCCVCLDSGFSCALPLLAWLLEGVCVFVRALFMPRNSWLGCALLVCVLWLGSRLRPATPGWGIGVCLCLFARSACIPSLLAGVCGVCVCVWAPVLAAPRHSCLGCWGVCVFVCALRLYAAIPGWDVRCGCVCLSSTFGSAPPLLAGLLGCVCVCVRAPLVARHSLLGSEVWMCVFGLRLRLHPATLGWAVGVYVCVHVRAPLASRHSWLGCAVWVGVLGLGFRQRPATPGWRVWVCVCLCAGSACTPPLLAGVCGVDVCVWAPVPAAPRHTWLGCWDVCLCLCAGSVFIPPLLAGV